MWVYSKEYQVFYEALRAKFIDKEYSGAIPAKARGIGTPTIWDKIDESGRYIAILRFGGGASQDPRYFYRLHKKFKIGEVVGGKVDDLAFSLALKYIGVSITSINYTLNKIYSLAEEVDALFKQFKEENHLIGDDSTDVDNSSLIASRSYKHNTADFEPSFEESLNTKKDNKFDHVSLMIEEFFASISLRRFEHAWELLSPAIRERVYLDNFSKFKLVYHNTRAIRYLVITDMKEVYTNKIDCIISYEDEIDAYTSADLDSFNSLTVDELEVFVEAINRLKQNVIKHGGERFGKIQLYKFFEPAPSENIWYPCDINPEKLSDLFSVKRTVSIKRNYKCSCNLIDGKWLIERITSIPISYTK